MNRSSLWQQTVTLPEFPSLAGDYRAEVVIIGGGLTGLLTAYLLKQRGVDALVLESGRIASGQTARTTAKITSQHDLIYDQLISKLGREQAAQYAQANEEAIAAYRQLIREQHIACDFSDCDAFLFARYSDETLTHEAEAARSLGLNTALTRETELPFPIAGALQFSGQARFHPLKFLHSLLPGLSIREQTRVLTVEGQQVHTKQGTVTAEHIVFASHYPFVNVPGWYFLRMHQERSYVLALESPWKPRHVYLGVDDDALSFREAGGLLLLGGGGHRTGEEDAGGHYALLREQADTLFPGNREVSCWSAQDCMTLDSVPYIGQYAQSKPNWHVATGFGKWGMTSAMAAAQLISGTICGAPPAWSGVFSPQRFHLSADAQSLANEAGHAIRGLSREVFALPQSTLDALPLGHGGVVEAEGRKVGVYRDMAGNCHTVDPRCPHLGCQLTWNPDELTWDCPCHGSRFTYEGELLDGPAQTSLTEK